MPVILFTTPGSGSWVKPAGVTTIAIECWGGGGRTTTSVNSGGGGGGAYGKHFGFENYPSQSVGNYPSESLVIPYHVAPGGGVGAGGATVWETNTGNYWVDNWNRIVALTGNDGTDLTRGLGAAADFISSTLAYKGGDGSRQQIVSTFSAGGGGAGSTGNGLDASSNTAGGSVAEFGGNGAGSSGLWGLYGGGGHYSQLDGIGAPGLIRITFPLQSEFEIGANKQSRVIISDTAGDNRFVNLNFKATQTI